MKLLQELKNAAESVTTALGKIDTKAIDTVTVIKNNPEAAEVLDVLESVAKAELPAGVISAAGTVFKFLVSAANPPLPLVKAAEPGQAVKGTEPDTTPANQPAMPEARTGAQLMGIA